MGSFVPIGAELDGEVWLSLLAAACVTVFVDDAPAYVANLRDWQARVEDSRAGSHAARGYMT